MIQPVETDKKPRVVHIISSLGRGGKERQLHELLRGLKDQSFLSLIVLSETLSYPVKELNIPVFTFSKSKRKRLSTYWAISSLIKKLNPEIVHYWDSLSFTYVLFGRLFSRYMIIDGSIRYAGKRERKGFLRLLKTVRFRVADRVVANSKSGLAVERMNDKQKAMVIHNGMDLTRFDATDKGKLDLPNLKQDSLKIVMVANFRPAKDYQTLINAAYILCVKYENLQFVLVGEGPDRSNIMRSVPDAIKDKILFSGRCDQIEKLLMDCDIGVLLSNTLGFAEGLSNSIMEYMAAGLPVVATNAGGTPELVLDGITGYLIDGFNVAELVQKLEALIISPNQRQDFGKAGYMRIKSDFGLENMVTGYRDLYLELTSLNTKK